MRPLKQIAFLAEDFGLPSPVQQLLDRFLIGFPRHGVFQRSQLGVTVWLANQTKPDLIQQRRSEFNLVIASSPEEAIRAADAVVVAPSRLTLSPDEGLVRVALQRAQPGTPVFVYGLLASSFKAAFELVALAKSRRCSLLAGTALPGTFLLPEVDVPAGKRMLEALIVVQGEFGTAEFNALEGLLPVLERRKRGESGVRRFRYVEGEELWRAGDNGDWSRPLLAAAISRSHTPQGNPVLDGRTEDLVGLGLVQKLARAPRGWLLEHRDGLRSALLVLDGAVGDFNFAVKTVRNVVISAQLFRPPLPQQEQYSRLAALLTDYFTSGRAPWPVIRSLMEADLIAAMALPAARGGGWIELAG